LSQLVAASSFVVELFEMKEPHDFTTRDGSGKDSVQILVAVDGCAVIEMTGAEKVTLTKGDAVVVPASADAFRVQPQWNVEFLKAYVPGNSLPDPATRI
jgi:mannose-6-phosphate isomerase class I